MVKTTASADAVGAFTRAGCCHLRSVDGSPSERPQQQQGGRVSPGGRRHGGGTKDEPQPTFPAVSSVRGSIDATCQAVLSTQKKVRALYVATHAKVGTRFFVAMVGVNVRSAEAGMLEAMLGIGGKLEAIAADEAGCPEPEFTGLEHLGAIGGWGVVSIRGRLLKADLHNFKFIDDTGLCVRVHKDSPITAPAGSRLELLMGTKSSRFGNIRMSAFSTPPEDALALASRVVFSL